MNEATFPSSIVAAVKRHQLIAAFVFLSVTLGSSWLGLKLSPRLFESTIRLIVAEQEVGISSVGQALTENTAQVPGKAADPVATQAELIESPAVLQRALKNFQARTDISVKEVPSLSELRQSMKIKVVPATNILSISLKGASPEVSAALLNEVAQAAVQENTNSIRTGASVLKNFLEKRVVEQDAILRRAANAQRRFQEQSSIVAVEDQSKSLVESVAALENEERTLRSQLRDATTQGRLLQQVVQVNSPQQAYAIASIAQDETLKSLQKQLSDIEVAIVDARSRLGDRHPDLLALLQKRDELRALYRQQFAQTLPATAGGAANTTTSPLGQDLMSRYITNELERRGLESRWRTVQSDLGQLQSRISRVPAAQESLAVLSRQRARAESDLNQLEDKLQEARIAESQILGNMSVLGNASFPTEPTSPKPLAILILSSVVGLLCAAAIVALLELLDTSLRSASDTEAALSLPILGEIPKSNPASTCFDLERFLDQSDQVEPYRVLLKTLQAIIDHEHPVIICSSSIIGEGKTAVVRHLAAVAASLTQRTLLIDADLRHPMHHVLLDDPASRGLAELVTGDLHFLDAVQSTAVTNLFVLPAGQRLGRPSTIIEMLLKTTLLQEASAHFDLVLIDTSPVNVCTDAATLSRATDGIFLIVRPQFTPRHAALEAVTKLNKMETPPIGIVFNQTVLTAETKSPILPTPLALESAPAPRSLPFSSGHDLHSRSHNTTRS